MTFPEVLIDPSTLRHRVRELGEEIGRAYRSSSQPPILISVLKGSSIFLADLMRSMEIDVEIDLMAISSYGDGRSSSGVVRIVKDLESDIQGRDVLIVEDIVDTGLTLNYLRRSLAHREPASLKAVTLLDKSARRIIPVPLEWAGFEIDDVFVLGYGLDHQGIYRNLDQLIAVRDIAALVAEPHMFVDVLFPGAQRPPSV